MLAAAVTVPCGGAVGADDGEAVYGQLCIGCHNTIGSGPAAGPDLAGLADRRDRAWVERFILAPDEVIASGDETARQLVAEYGVQMPNLGVTRAQLDALMPYLGFAAATPSTTPTTPTTSTAPAAPAAPAAPGTAGDAGRGENLFTGAEDFAEGGPSCLACHSVAGVGSLGGGQVGPDLTGAFAKYGGRQGLDGVLGTVAFPTMVPIYTRNPLTASERADLAAFLEGAPERSRPSAAAGKLLGLSIGTAALLAVLGWLIWKGRLTGVRRPLVNRAREMRRP